MLCHEIWQKGLKKSLKIISLESYRHIKD